MRANATRLRNRSLLSPGRLALASDQRLVEHLRAGSERAFETLFDRHRPSVLAFCTRVLGSREEAEDVVQQTFLVAYCEIVDSDAPIAFRAWLYGIARHRCLSALRGRRAHPVGDVLELALTDHLDAEVATREDLRAMLVDIAGLPSAQRTALVLAELEDLSYGEIAQVLGCRREKVKALVFQARSSLIAGRTAREVTCAEIRRQLSELRGAALRRATLRRHLRDCSGCRAFRDAVRAERGRLKAWLPLAAILTAKRAVQGSLFGSGGAAGGAALGGGALGGGGALAAAIAVVAIPAGGIVAAVSVASQSADPARSVSRAQAALHGPSWPSAERVAARGVLRSPHRDGRHLGVGEDTGRATERPDRAASPPTTAGETREAGFSPAAEGERATPGTVDRPSDAAERLEPAEPSTPKATDGGKEPEERASPVRPPQAHSGDDHPGRPTAPPRPQHAEPPSAKSPATPPAPAGDRAVTPSTPAPAESRPEPTEHPGGPPPSSDSPPGPTSPPAPENEHRASGPDQKPH